MTRTIRNACMPINRFPPEILSSVLEHRTSDLDLVVATRVCRYWRYTLTSSPCLWTSFRFSGPNRDVNRTLTYLERSKSAPIDVRVGVGRPQDLEVLKYLAPHITRTRSLAIQGYYTEVCAASLLLRTPSPILQHLEISAYRGLVRLPDDFLGQQAPSLRSLSLDGIDTAFESHFPLPNLTEFKLSLPEGAGPFRVGALFQFLSGCPSLQKICIDSKEMPEEITLGQVISLESLVDLSYTCSSVGQILPYLRLPRLERLRVSSSFGSGQEQRLADLLPHGGHVLLAGATKMSYYSYKSSQELRLRGKGTDLSFVTSHPVADRTPVYRFFDEAYIPFGQIEDLTVGGSFTADFPINILAFKNLRVLRIVPQGVGFAEWLLPSLYPHPGTEIPCRSLQEIQYGHLESTSPLMDLVRERKRAGHPLGLVGLLTLTGHGPGQDLVEELKEHVEEVRIGKWDGTT